MENDALTRQLLSWITEQPRSYSETMEAWRTSCPRLSIWEDALTNGFVIVESKAVKVSPKGQALLDRTQ